MAESSTSRQPGRPHVIEPHLPDDVTVKHWLVFYAVVLVGCVVALAVLIAGAGWSWNAWVRRTAETFAETSISIKLVGFFAYLTLCTTLLPLPTGWLVAGVATREASVASGLAGEPGTVALLTAVIVGGVGALGSTIANLNDYHLFTWMLRHKRIANVRHTRTYQAAARWFAAAPFTLLLAFNVIPIPVDVVRLLAITYRYPRAPFAAANLIGRFIRYGVIAYVTYRFDLGWIAVLGLLAVAVVLGGVKLLPAAVRRIANTQPNPNEDGVSDPPEGSSR